MTDAVLIGQFERWATGAEEEIPLDGGAIAIARSEYPELDAGQQLAALDSLARAVSRRLQKPAEPLASLNAISGFLFDEIGFKGNEADYYDPRNSYLNEVLTRRLGIPITLSLLYMEVGRRLGVPIVPVGMPGHLLVRHLDVEELFVDPFAGGILLNPQECIQRFEQLTHATGAWKDEYLQTLGNRAFMGRMLRNLKAAYGGKRDLERSLTVLDLLVALEPQSTLERRDRGLVHYRLGHTERALVDLRTYLGTGPLGAEARRVYELVERLSHESH